MQKINSLKKIKILDVPVHLFDKDSLLETIVNCTNKSGKTIIGYHNLHSVYLYLKNSDTRNFYKLCKFVFVDGMSLVWLGKLFLKEIGRANRFTYLDFIEELLLLLNRSNKKIFYLGSKQKNQKQIKDAIGRYIKFENIKVHHGYFDKENFSDENEELIESINNFAPDILLVGMGMPVQEKWITSNLNMLPNGLIMNCGACMEYLAGIEKKPSRESGRMGFEWLIRLINNPKKMWYRYLIEPFLIILYYLRYILFK